MTAKTSQFTLPAWRYIPGLTRRHPEGAFEEIKSLCPDNISSDTVDENPCWQHALRLFDAGFYWEAHEILEELWQRANPNSRERFLCQCLIHLANAALKTSQGFSDAAGRILQLAQECHDRAFAGTSQSLMGLESKEIVAVCHQLNFGKKMQSLSKCDL